MPVANEEPVPDTQRPYVRKAVRSYLGPAEVQRLIAAAGKVGRQGLRDRVLLQLVYRHALRVSEAVDARWTDFDLDGPAARTYHVRRLKGSADSLHTLNRDEVLALRKLRDRQQAGEPFLFMSERGKRLSTDMVGRIIERAGALAGLGHVHPHMLRHAAGYMLANQGTDTRAIQNYLGHRNIQHTVRYTELSRQRLAHVRVL
jgi:type 1 fimbriae regulatory protein FimB/type 1 fimbriae regulatory protein FimE